MEGETTSPPGSLHRILLSFPFSRRLPLLHVRIRRRFLFLFSLDTNTCHRCGLSARRLTYGGRVGGWASLQTRMMFQPDGLSCFNWTTALFSVRCGDTQPTAVRDDAAAQRVVL